MKQKKHSIDIKKYIVDENEKLGEGTFCTVYRGEVKETQEKIAVKVFSTKKQCSFYFDLDRPFIVEMIEKELSILRKLSSVNIINFYDVLVSDKQRIFLTFELGDSDLGNKKFSGCIFSAISQIANGMKNLIQNGIIHRNLSPKSIFIKDGVLKIGNFRHSRTINRNQFATAQTGAKEYMSPQMLLRQKYSFKCDIWSFGVLCYQIATGQLPWNPQTLKIRDLRDFGSSLKNVSSDNILFPESFDEELSDLIRKCLKYKEEDRISWNQIFHHEFFKGKFAQERDIDFQIKQSDFQK